jgi:nucleoside-diphosphate-sugar epimerase
MAHTIIRPSAVYGPLDVEDRVISKFMLAAMRDDVLNVNGGEECLDFTYVDDAALGIAMAAVSDNSYNTTYNITRGHARSLLQAAKLCVDIVGHGHVQIRLPDTNFPTRGQLNIQRARLDFEYHPQVDIEQGFRLYYNWLKNRQVCLNQKF